MPLPDKPRYSQPCNNCGQCCDREICPVGELAFPGAHAPCPGLLILTGGNAALCGIVQTEKAFGLPPTFANKLGIGCGCSMWDADTTEEQAAEFNRVSLLKIYGKEVMPLAEPTI